MQYTFNCSEHNAVMTTEATNDAEALKALMKSAKEHMKTAHAGSKVMTDEEIEKMIRAGWKKEETKKGW